MYIRKAPLGAATPPLPRAWYAYDLHVRSGGLGTIAVQNGHGFSSDQIRSISFEPPPTHRSVFRPSIPTSSVMTSHGITVELQYQCVAGSWVRAMRWSDHLSTSPRPRIQ